MDELNIDIDSKGINNIRAVLMFLHDHMEEFRNHAEKCGYDANRVFNYFNEISDDYRFEIGEDGDE